MRTSRGGGIAYFPPDLTVPLGKVPAAEEEWKRADADGSADGAYALGVLRGQKAISRAP
jgi:hypothetical protein